MTTKKKPSWYTGALSLLDANEEQVKEYFEWVDSFPPPLPRFENNRYTFKSRYGEERYFELENGEWCFGGKDLDLCLRIGFKTDRNDPDYLDPSGGPFLSRASKFRDYISVLPEHDLTITGFKNENGRWKILTIGAKETKS
jgi:hypothetical protein